MNPTRAVTRPRLDVAERKLAELDDPAHNPPTPPLPRRPDAHPHKTAWVAAGTKAVRLPCAVGASRPEVRLP